MNFFSIFGPLAILLFANYTPIQGQSYTVYQAFANNQMFVPNSAQGRSLLLARLRSDTYAIKEIVTPTNMQAPEEYTRATFDIKGFYTMLRDVVVLITNGDPVQVELHSVEKVRELYATSVRRTLNRTRFTHGIAAIYKAGEGEILSELSLSLSGYTDTLQSSTATRFMIHTKGGSIRFAVPYIMWSSGNFNYRYYNDTCVVVTLPRQGNVNYEYYLIQFSSENDCYEFRENYATSYSNNIPEAPANIQF